ncbi:MAG: peptidylprolyl isomerase [Spirochaetes bacterium]|nr:peptidylprolyl isomerase [Spirochaetota bacterium]
MAQNKIAPKQDKDPAKAEMAKRFKTNPAVFIGTLFVLVLVVISFVLVPAIVPEFTRERDFDLTFGFYDRVPIAFVPGNHFAQNYEMISRAFGGAPEPGTFQSMNIWRMSFEAAAVHTGILEEMRRANYAVPDNVIDRAVARRPEFQIDGRFSPALWNNVSEQSRRALWRQTQEEFVRAIYVYDMATMLGSAGEAAFISGMSERMRSFDMVSFPLDDFPDSELAAFAGQNSDNFRTMRLSRISVATEAGARQVLAAVAEGTSSFEEAALLHSLDGFSSAGGSMGVRVFAELQNEIFPQANLDAITALAEGELSDVFQIGHFWTFFRVDETLAAADFSDPDVLERVRIHVSGFSRGIMEDWAIAQAADFAAEAGVYGFDSALAQRALSRSSFGPLPVNFGNVDLFASVQFFPVPELANSASDENFWMALFATPVGSVSAPLVQGNNVLVFMPTEESQAEDFIVEGIASTVSNFWLANLIDQSIHNHFLNSDRLDDRFFETYFRLFLAPGF